MFGRDKRRRKGKRDAAVDAVGSAGEGMADGGLPDGCGCDLPLVALTVMAGASLLLFAR